MKNTNRGMHGDSLPMLSPLGLSNRKPLPLGMGYITRLACLVLCVSLALGVVGVALAETAEEKGIQAIWDMLNENFEEDGAGGLFQKDTFSVSLTEDGEIVINTDASVVMAVFGTGGEYAAEIMSRMWFLFAASSRVHTEAPVYMFLNYKGETLYFITPEWVLDVGNERVYEHVKQN